MKTIIFIFLILTFISFSTIAFSQTPKQSENVQIQKSTEADSLLAKVKELDSKVQNIEKNIQFVMSITRWVVGLALAMVSLFYGLTTFLQYRKDLRDTQDYEKRLKLLSEQFERQSAEGKEQLKIYESFIRRQEEKSDKLLESTRNNINQTTELLGALEGIFQFRGQTHEMEIQLKKFAEEFKKQKDVETKVFEEVNAEAIEICRNFNRYTYSSAENQALFQKFSSRLTDRMEKYEFNDLLNANCYLILGLNFDDRNLDNRLKNLQIAIDKSKRFFRDGADNPILFPDMTQDEIKNWNRNLASISLYHAAILNYNFGEYRKAEGMFQNALDYVHNDIKSELYIPEAKFLGGYVTDFHIIEEDFERIAKRIEDIQDIENWGEVSKDSLLSQLYLRFGNCYFAKSKYPHYQKFRSLKKSIEKYNKAYNYAKESYVTQFSYAQVLNARAKQPNIPEAQKQEDREIFNDLFRKVFVQVREKIAGTTEAKILMMLYYMLAICCKEAKIEGENPKMYLLEIHREVGNLPSKEKLKIFSPLTKNDFIYKEFLKEVNEFESTL